MVNAKKAPDKRAQLLAGVSAGGQSAGKCDKRACVRMKGKLCRRVKPVPVPREEAELEVAEVMAGGQGPGRRDTTVDVLGMEPEMTRLTWTGGPDEEGLMETPDLQY